MSGNPIESELQGIVGTGERRQAVWPEGRQGGIDAADAPVDAEDTLSVPSQAAAVLQRHAHFLDLEQGHNASISNNQSLWVPYTSHSRK